MNARVNVETPADYSDRPGEVDDLLQGASLLSDLSAESRAELRAGAELVELRAGEWLFRRADAGDALYLVRSGRLDAVAESLRPGGIRSMDVIRVLRRGECVGELSLITGAPRSASVRARRDSTLLRIDRDRFESLLGDPAVVSGLLRRLGAQLRVSRGAPADRSGPPIVLAIVGAGAGAGARELSDELGERMGRWSEVAVIDHEPGEPRTDVDHAVRLDRLERSGARVLLVVDQDADRSWRSFCIRQADLVLVATRCDGAPPDLAGATRCDLLLRGVGEGSGVARRWVTALQPRTTYRVSDREAPADLDRVARRLSGRAIGVVLSGGGARGFGHIGALDALIESGIEIDRVGGCSMGAIVGGLFASGRDPEEIHELCRDEFVHRKPLGDYTVPVAGLVRGQRAEAMMGRLFGERRIEELARGFFCVSCDLISGECVFHQWGPAARLIGASASLPGITPPVAEDGRLLVDGGVLNNLPVERMAATGEGPVIAVDVTARFDRATAPARGRPRARRLAARARQAVVGSAEPLPMLRETLIRSVALGSIDTAAAARAHADVVVEPLVAGYGMTAFDRLDEIVVAGREAALDRAGTMAGLVKADEC